MKHYIATILLFLSLLVGCKTLQPAVVYRDSVRVEYKLDSIYIYLHDSIYVDRWRSNDTVYITTEKYSIKYKDKIVNTTDTIYLDKQSVIKEQYIPKWMKIVTIIGSIIIILFIIWLLIKIIK